MFECYLFMFEPQKGQNSLGLRSLFPQLGQKEGFGCRTSVSGKGGGGIAVVGVVAFGFSKVPVRGLF